jgi:ribosomal protein S20
MRSALRSFRKRLAAGEELDKKQELASIYSLLDVQARKGIIHHRKAARLKSRLSALSQK